MIWLSVIAVILAVVAVIVAFCGGMKPMHVNKLDRHEGDILVLRADVKEFWRALHPAMKPEEIIAAVPEWAVFREPDYTAYSVELPFRTFIDRRALDGVLGVAKTRSLQAHGLIVPDRSGRYRLYGVK